MATRIPRQLALRFFSKPGCPLCHEAKEELINFASTKNVRLNIQEVNILLDENRKWHDEFVFEIPVVQLASTGEEIFRHRMNETKVLKFINDYAKETSL